MKTDHLRKILGRLMPVFLIISYTLCSIVSLFSIRNTQGDGQVINYTGIVRGATQRLVKQELQHNENDALIKSLDEILQGLSEGDQYRGLEKMQSQKYQDYVSRLCVSWERLKEEIYLVRDGKDSNLLYSLSETYFTLANEAVTEAEHYSKEKVQKSIRWILLMNIVFAGIIVLFWFYRRYQKKMYHDLQAAEQASSQKSEFLSRMSHEIRTPMNGIIGMTEIASRNLDDREKVADCLYKVSLSSRHLLALINDVLDMAKIENGRIELHQSVFSMQEVLDEMDGLYEEQAAQKEVHFKTVREKGVDVLVAGDELRLRQILTNLLANAFKFTPPGGTVSLHTFCTAENEKNLWLRFEVGDTGCGIPKDKYDKIFEEFEQENSGIAGRYGGTGLGLSIVKNLAELMGGSVEVASEVGKGSRFSVEIPFTRAEALSGDGNPDEAQNSDETPNPDGGQNPCGERKYSKKEKEQKEYDFHGKRILLAEDNELNREIAAELLGRTGADIDYACNGKEAVELFEKSGKGYYDIILMDIQMPDMDGYEASGQIRSMKREDAKKVPILAMTANAFKEDQQKSRNSGMNAHIAKPIDVKILYEEIERFT